jgi:acyl carrier protein
MNTVIENLQTIAPEVAAADVQRDQPLRDQIDLDSMDFLNFIISLHKTLGCGHTGGGLFKAHHT